MSQHNLTEAGIAPNYVYITEEAAALLRCKPSTIRAAIRKGKIRGAGRPFRILGSELLRFALGGAR
jgi:excisionase family DNA binding protein